MSGQAAGRPPVVVMGVSGSGKTTVAKALAVALDAPFCEGDDLHPEVNRAKMARGESLDDEDRWPWLAVVAQWLADHSAPPAGVASCSALKRSYRDALREVAPNAWFLLLHGDPDLLRERQADREGHFMPSSLMGSQLATLEPLGPDEAGARLDVAADVATLVRQAREALAR